MAGCANGSALIIIYSLPVDLDRLIVKHQKLVDVWKFISKPAIDALRVPASVDLVVFMKSFLGPFPGALLHSFQASIRNVTD